jgi:hypothetical protein
LMPEDEVLAVDAWRVANDLAVLGRTEEGPSQWTVARRGAIHVVGVELKKQPEQAYVLEVDPEAPSSAHRARAAWLGGR